MKHWIILVILILLVIAGVRSENQNIKSISQLALCLGGPLVLAILIESGRGSGSMFLRILSTVSSIIVVLIIGLFVIGFLIEVGAGVILIIAGASLYAGIVAVLWAVLKRP